MSVLIGARECNVHDGVWCILIHAFMRPGRTTLVAITFGWMLYRGSPSFPTPPCGAAFSRYPSWPSTVPRTLASMRIKLFCSSDLVLSAAISLPHSFRCSFLCLSCLYLFYAFLLIPRHQSPHYHQLIKVCVCVCVCVFVGNIHGKCVGAETHSANDVALRYGEMRCDVMYSF